VGFSAFGPGPLANAVLTGFEVGEPTKVLIVLHAQPHPALQITGVECATNLALRFCYGDQPQLAGCGFAQVPAPAASFAKAGDTIVRIEANQTVGPAGYILFPDRGKYLISVRSRSTLLGVVVVLVI
jgi:hypothetical protein